MTLPSAGVEGFAVGLVVASFLFVNGGEGGVRDDEEVFGVVKPGIGDGPAVLAAEVTRL